MSSNVGLLCRKYVDRAMIEYELPRSEASTNLLCMVAAHESGGFKYCRQIGGPAVSIFQMEPATFYDVFQYFLAYSLIPGRSSSLGMASGILRKKILAMAAAN